MIESIEYNGYDFDQDTATIRNLSGIGMPNIRTSSEDRALQDGAIGTSFRFGGRVIGWSGAIAPSTKTMAAYLAERQKIGYALGALTETGKTMEFELSTGDTRTLRNVVPTAQPVFDFPEDEPSLLWNSYTVTFRADFPYFEGTSRTSTQSITVISGGVVVPAPVAAPLATTSGSSSSPVTITNAGSAPSWPTMTITGPVTNARVTNSTTGHYFVLNATIPAGESVTIDMWSRTAVNNNTGENLIGSYDGDYIYLEGGVAGADNTISFTGTGTSAPTTLDISWKDSYYML